MSAPAVCHRFTAWPAISLVAAACVGAVLMPALVDTESRSMPLAARLLFALHGGLSGASVMVAAWLVLYRAQGRLWNTPAVALVAIAASALWFFPLVTRSVDGHLFYANPGQWLLAARAAHDPALLALAAYFQCWPATCLAVWTGCCLSGQSAGWWKLRGWWPESLSMWLLAAWSLPAPYLAWQLWQFVRLDFLISLSS